MENNNLQEKNKDFRGFLSTITAKELEYFMLSTKFTSEFNYRMKKLFEEIKGSNREEIEFSIIFNTKGEISLIDSVIIGDFISDDYVVNIKEKYKKSDINNILKTIINGSDKGKNDFIIVSAMVIYNIFQMIYEEIKCRVDIIHDYVSKYNLNVEENTPIAVIVITLLIMEDICGYIGIDKKLLKNVVNSKSFF